MKIKDFIFIRSFLYLFQLENYQVERFLKLIVKNPFPIKVEKVKQLAWTPKARWIFNLSILLIVFQTVILGCVTRKIYWIIISITLSYLFSWIYLIIAFLFRRPLEIFNKRLLIKLCNQKVNLYKRNGMKVIGITGSYGKTSTKMFVKQILSEKYDTYATPQSYNTLFGIAQPTFKLGFVNSALNELKDSTKYFCVEMGAYVRGEIKELCSAFPPDISVITGVTAMHLERFKTLKNIVLAKSEIADALKPGSTLFINGDNFYTKKIALKYKEKGLNVIKYGFGPDNDYRGIIANMDKNGTRLTVISQDKTKFELETNIIGTGIMRNIICAVAIAHEENIPEEKIVNGVKNLEQVEARMQVIDNGNGIIMINNGYNSNIESFKQTIETLKLFNSEYKVLVTPGIFELGNSSYKVHKRLGKLIDSKIDLVVLLGKNLNTPQIRGLMEGLKIAGYPNHKIEFVNNIKEFYTKITQRNLIPCVVAFENDLPDNYNF